MRTPVKSAEYVLQARCNRELKHHVAIMIPVHRGAKCGRVRGSRAQCVVREEEVSVRRRVETEGSRD